jgi:type VII secretion integral membrane protein EccD
MSAVAALGLLEISPRVSIAWARLSPRLPPPAGPEISAAPNRLHQRAIQADKRLTSLVLAFASAAAIGAVSTSIDRDGSRLSGVVFATLTGAALLLRARSHLDLPRTLGLLATGTATVSIAFVVAAANAPQHTAWIAAGATTMTAAAVYLGFVAPGVTFSPVARRGVELLEYVGFAAMVPLACWTCGFYSAARGLHLL